MPDNEEFDPFAFSSGLVDDVEVAFKSCRFGTLSTYMDGEQLLYIIDAIVDGEDGPEEQELMYSCGKGWEAKDKGRLCVREDGKTKNFNKSSAYAMLLAAAMEAGAPLRDVADENGPMSAALMEGMIFHMKRKAVNYGGEIGSKDRLLPTEYKGRKGDKATPAKATSTKATAASDDGEAEATPAANGTVSAALKVKLRKAAKEADGSFEDFVALAYEIDGVMDNPDAEALVLDESDAGIFAKAQA